jgi:hypothetical protein
LLVAAISLVDESTVRLHRGAGEPVDDAPHVRGEVQQSLSALGADGSGHHLVPELQACEPVGVQQARHRDAVLGLDAPGTTRSGE